MGSMVILWNLRRSDMILVRFLTYSILLCIVFMESLTFRKCIQPIQDLYPKYSTVYPVFWFPTEKIRRELSHYMTIVDKNRDGDSYRPPRYGWWDGVSNSNLQEYMSISWMILSLTGPSWRNHVKKMKRCPKRDEFGQHSMAISSPILYLSS